MSQQLAGTKRREIIVFSFSGSEEETALDDRTSGWPFHRSHPIDAEFARGIGDDHSNRWPLHAKELTFGQPQPTRRHSQNPERPL
jgi:hypothetical protein